MKTLLNPIIRLHEKTSNFTAQKIGPLVFNFGTDNKPWGLSTAMLKQFPEGSLGKVVGEFLYKNRMEPIAGAESHDVYHVLFDFSTSFKDEIGLQFFLRGNGKKSIASFLTSIGAWVVLPFSYNYLKSSYEKGKNCIDISQLNLRELLYKDFESVKQELFSKVSSTQLKSHVE